MVISIIGILSSLSTASVNIARKKSRDAKRQSDISQVQLALYLYFDDNLNFPVADLLPENAVDNWNNILRPQLSGELTGRPYMLLVPNDPINEEPYLYGYNSTGVDFVLTFYKEDGGPQEFRGY